MLWKLMVVLGLSASLARVQAQAEPTRDAEARELFEQGQAEYNGGRYGEAMVLFQRSYDLSERTELLFNVGHAAQLAGEWEQAMSAFERYLELSPDSAANRQTVSERLSAIRERVSRDAHSADVASSPERAERVEHTDPPEGESSNSSERRSPTAGIALSLSGLALAAGGGLSLGLAAKSAHDVNSVTDGTPWAQVEADYNAVRRRRILGASLGAAGIALAAIGAVLWVRGRRPLDVGISAEGLRLRGSF